MTIAPKCSCRARPRIRTEWEGATQQRLYNLAIGSEERHPLGLEDSTESRDALRLTLGSVGGIAQKLADRTSSGEWRFSAREEVRDIAPNPSSSGAAPITDLMENPEVLVAAVGERRLRGVPSH